MAHPASSISLWIGVLLLLLSGGCSLAFLWDKPKAWIFATPFASPFILLGLVLVGNAVFRKYLTLFGVAILILLAVVISNLLAELSKYWDIILVLAAPNILLGFVAIYLGRRRANDVF